MKMFAAAHQISHLYFTGKDRINFLRVHNRDQHGDLINRYTTLQAEKTGRLFSGLEIGVNGALTLRVVMPWQDESGQLIGYLVIGKEVNDILKHLSTRAGTVMVEAYRKSYLEWENFASWTANAGYGVLWDRLEDYAVIESSTFARQDDILRAIADPGEDVRRFGLNDRVYEVMTVSLQDVTSQQVGKLALAMDITEAVAQYRSRADQ